MVGEGRKIVGEAIQKTFWMIRNHWCEAKRVKIQVSAFDVRNSTRILCICIEGQVE
jgi:hypothetical protein